MTIKAEGWEYCRHKETQIVVATDFGVFQLTPPIPTSAPNCARTCQKENGMKPRKPKISKTSMSGEYPPLSPVTTGIRGLCPRCGRGHLFDGFLSLRKSCDACGLDYSFADPADGPAFFVICFACVPSVLLSVWLEVSYNASILAQLLITGPFLLISCIPPLRPLKGWLVSSQYYYKAREGTIDKE